MCRMMLVLQDVMYPSQRVVEMVLVSGKPHQESIDQHAASWRVVEVNHELLRDSSTPEFPQVEEALLGLFYS